MIHAENQVRNFYFVSGAPTKDNPTKADLGSTPGEACGTLEKGKYFINYVDFNGKVITSDVINQKCIEQIRISKPVGWKGSQFTLKPKAGVSLQNGDVVVFDFHFTNVFGFSDREQYHRAFPITYTSTGDSILKKLYDNLKAGSDHKLDNIFWSVFELGAYTASPESLVIKQVKQEYNAVLGYMPHTVKCMISAQIIPDMTNTTPTTRGSYIDTLNASSVEVGALANYAVNKNGISSNVATGYTKTNGFKVYDLEYAQSKVRADMYGYNGYPDVNPSMMICPVPDDDDTYFIVDIRYHESLSGINVQKSQKELTLAAANTGDLIKVLAGLVSEKSGNITVANEGDPGQILTLV